MPSTTPRPNFAGLVKAIATQKIKERYDLSPKLFGKPLGEIKLSSAPTAIYYQDYEFGSISYYKSKTVATTGDVCKRWRSVGGAQGLA